MVRFDCSDAAISSIREKLESALADLETAQARYDAIEEENSRLKARIGDTRLSSNDKATLEIARNGGCTEDVSQEPAPRISAQLSQVSKTSDSEILRSSSKKYLGRQSVMVLHGAEDNDDMCFGPPECELMRRRTHVIDPLKGSKGCQGVAKKSSRKAALKNFFGEEGTPKVEIGWCGWCLLSPVGKPRLTWDVLWCFFLAFDIWITLFSLVFLNDKAFPPSLVLMYYVTMGFWFCDIGVNMSTGVHVGKVIIMNRKVAMKKYFKSWFAFDILVTVPWDKLMQIGGSTISVARMVKASKAIKLLKVLKLLRAIKTWQLLKKHQKWKARRELLQLQRWYEVQQSSLAQRTRVWLGNKAELLVKPFLVVTFLALWSHFHAILWGVTQVNWAPSNDPASAFHAYYESYWWALITLLSVKSPITASNALQWSLEILISIERLAFVGVGLVWLIYKALIEQENDARITMYKRSALTYMRNHEVSVITQLQVMNSMNTTHRARQVEHNFSTLMTQELPEELQRTIREELWSQKLLSLDFMRILNHWDACFLHDISQVIKEESHANAAVLCKEGSMPKEVYFILEGVVRALRPETSDNSDDDLWLFSKGNWIGERALIDADVLWDSDIVTAEPCTLMTLQVADFHNLLEDFGLSQPFRALCVEELPHGLCGRCGKLGDHFPTECPLLGRAATPRLACKALHWPWRDEVLRER
eukprot:TRINITY_DN16867_c0_g1_i1.p1 TRINITY_DN16867_c0_g1~~TRINITY_DN16867_c0_g1_i1.p1  ORF type:complete len:719 (-),score=110.65 TRINITY_DN16867_c0_g1_i1:60-2174(-)